VFSDDMQMQAISKEYALDDAIKRAINSGIDILCFANNIPMGDKSSAEIIHAIIRKAVDDGAISKKRINQSYKRIMKLKAKVNSKRSAI
jgi:beta-N-acetylhexosaminidase